TARWRSADRRTDRRTADRSAGVFLGPFRAAASRPRRQGIAAGRGGLEHSAGSQRQPRGLPAFQPVAGSAARAANSRLRQLSARQAVSSRLVVARRLLRQAFAFIFGRLGLVRQVLEIGLEAGFHVVQLHQQAAETGLLTRLLL